MKVRCLNRHGVGLGPAPAVLQNYHYRRRIQRASRPNYVRLISIAGFIIAGVSQSFFLSVALVVASLILYIGSF